MTIQQLSDFLLWNLILNYALLIIWSAVFLMARDWVYSIHRKFFDISKRAFNAFNYGGIGLYKMLIFIFCLIPYIALQITA